MMKHKSRDFLLLDKSMTRTTYRKIIGVFILALSFFTFDSDARAEFCLTPNGSLSLGYPGITEANIGFTVGRANVNPQSSCDGAMFDLGVNGGALRAAAGVRTFQRYDFPTAAQIDAFIYKGFPDSSVFSGGTCVGIEGGFGALLTMLRLGVGMCSEWNFPLLVAHFGIFI